MTKKFTSKKLLIASNNKGKVQEIRDLLTEYNIEVLSAADFGLEEPEENGKDFIENSQIKARYYGSKTNLPALADDSGLCVDALGGQPGIYSARWAGPDKDFKIAMKRIEDQIAGKEDKSAHFVCALSLYWPDDKHIESFEGTIEGKMAFPAKGEKGFGYDPVFIPQGYKRTFAELDIQEKQRISHRAVAFDKMIKTCFN